MCAQIKVIGEPDGGVTYVIDQSPSLLPAVTTKHLLAAWEVASAGARRHGADHCARPTKGACRLVFLWGQGQRSQMVLADDDARCWADAVADARGIDNGYGLSIYLRLLALIDLLSRVAWAKELVVGNRHSIKLSAKLLRLAAQAQLTPDARFDEQSFRGSLL